MFFVLMALFAAAVAAVDQVTKFLTVANIGLNEQVSILPGVLGLTYVRNTGAAFSSVEGMQGMFALFFAVFTAMIFWEYLKKPMPFSKFERWCIAAIYGGGLGNMIDRIRLGYVVDMLRTEFIDFPVFNVADCFITCGCIALLISLVCFNKQFWKEEKK